MMIEYIKKKHKHGLLFLELLLLVQTDRAEK
jgi:hypothetical protein